MNNYQNKIRARFAPSPTGYLHIGGARTALFNFLFTKKNKGSFILRIEDTDLERSLEDSAEKILEDLKWLGINWDEGPDIGGDFGPYSQTQRLPLYHKYAEKLLKEGKAYYCYCAPEELEEKRKSALERKETPRYDGKCKNLTQSQREKLILDGRKKALRFIVPEKDIIVEDLIKGKVEFKKENFSDFIILKSNLTPSYNFAVTIDDLSMRINYVIRGDEHLINTPRQIMLYEALGEALPKFAHLPMILAADHSKLSKRHGTTAVGEFREEGFLPQALINYIALLGWSPSGNQEFFSQEELIQGFSLERVAKNSAIFDKEKLKWMNNFYIKKTLPEDLVLQIVPFLKKSELLKDNYDKKWLENLVFSFQENLNTLEEIVELSKDFFKEKIMLTPEALSLLNEEKSKNLLKVFKSLIQKEIEIIESNFKIIINETQKISALKGKELYMPIRAALTGNLHGLELAKVFSLLG
ncbi:MAG: glutamate--tRNA ligase [Armatimonadetes bacterium]|nr:glutamate--tRNA ligase [Armatimonadota bacterium]